MDGGERGPVDEHRAESVKEDLECAKERLPKDRVEENGLKGSRKIGVKTIDPERFVVRQVVWLQTVRYCFAIPTPPGDVL